MNRVAFVRKTLKAKVLDVGFVSGTLHNEILDEFGQKNVVGLDTEVKKTTKFEVKGSAEKMPFKANTFNSIMAGELIEHVHQPQNFVRESFRILKKGGVLLITTPNVKSLVNRVFKNYHHEFHVSLFTKEKLWKLLEDEGFKIESYRTFPYTEESCNCSRLPTSIKIRALLHHVLPESLRENMCFVAVKK